ncbi:glycosyltransferase [Zhengella mangrovi]|uniref:glycosyltransferase n=1 Tax=Zhengella mangrovi TaxID=1982044 RepID=UPI0010542D04|nr:glycosyltransferase [Zhengella mangrovi]
MRIVLLQGQDRGKEAGAPALPGRGHVVARTEARRYPQPGDASGLDPPPTGTRERDQPAAGPASPDLLHAESRRLVRVFADAGIPPQRTLQLIRRARENGTSVQEELLALPGTDTARYFRCLAREFGLRFRAVIDHRHVAATTGDRPQLIYQQPGGRPERLVSPDISDLQVMQRLQGARQGTVEHLTVVSPHVLRGALLQCQAGSRVGDSAGRLFVRRPDLSARLVANTWQSLVAGMLLVAIPAGLFVASQSTLALLHGLASLFFLSCLVLRVLALPAAGTRRPAPLLPSRPCDLPRYTVLVAAYREAPVIGELLVHLGQLRWPRSKLEIKIVCEADDRPTIEAVHAHALAALVEVIEVPPGGPRTKPNALSYALPLTRGDFVVLYDAEDRPHPDQLLEAWQAFDMADDRLACLQAPLFVRNSADTWLTAMFALEYASLFRGLLVALARRHRFLPLGGTSNHFRRRVLDAALGWDPYNVTEDADLAVRLVRLGYRIGVIARPTLEDAPDRLGDWLGQRTRWLKGWMQCWLVHTRAPLRLVRETGLADFLVIQVFLLGIVFCALVHPAAYVLAALYWTGALKPPEGPALALWYGDLAVMAAAYLTQAALGLKAMSRLERARQWRFLPVLPLYWLLQSWAAWRALASLVRSPHYWHKTPHRPSSLRRYPAVR